ncbi:MAG: MOSC domain-containing protein [Ignavibacteriales bacterium CG12_big_fil_rev_8_21_14_0_65_30_8]|nr:MAG: MOSC domain-containing protein [Ignavibacteriales bacterium CG12_big_fil_rev_8_21_14_0_65_30_8]
MNKLILSQIFIYPVKSFCGISVDTSDVTERGLEYDRRWLLVDDNNVFITQRDLPDMALIKTSIINNTIQLKHKIKNIDQISIPTSFTSGKELNVKIWDDNCLALHYNSDIDKWLSKVFNKNCKLVYMPDSTQRFVDNTYAKNKEIVSFADGFSFLIIGQSSLDDLNNKLDKPIPINRFRPNFVFTGGTPFEEDKLKKIKIGKIIFDVVKPCERCVIPTTDQDTGKRNKEPLLTLSGYRKINNKVMFGQNLIQHNLGEISVGDEIAILERKD